MRQLVRIRRFSGILRLIDRFKKTASSLRIIRYESTIHL